MLKIIKCHRDQVYGVLLQEEHSFVLQSLSQVGLPVSEFATDLNNFSTAQKINFRNLLNKFNLVIKKENSELKILLINSQGVMETVGQLKKPEILYKSDKNSPKVIYAEVRLDLP